ncbi:MAG: 2Fe-2S iron-sulfur cluster binding domain-containing protein [Candidatus Methanolliviera hydrocarbonicum]|uniref:2Fe-2S iron-sulfur cluster binding domain-containing protein n=1 Tax=Candidatus Methanolliviera hydrocarbonicum TaxID=2491085 RepID=A0A520KW01_9EURY|nr:MAG: 2Fe-2S iron-sulfur cluster binding domain-containing protein [Candidatus Methanolliviera hydrocarbonicum]
MKKINFEIDGREVEAEEGTTLLEVARSIGIDIPTLCYHPALEPLGACRLCSVEIVKRGRKRVVTACNYPVEDGLLVRTDSPDIIEIRTMLLELLLARCPEEERIQNLAREYGVVRPRFKLEDESCILCGLCTRVCEELVGVSAINVINRGVEREVDTPYKELSDDCIGCGLCALLCPTDAIKRMKNIYPTTAEDIKETEDRFLDGVRDEELGVYSDLIGGKTSIAGQDGGMVTSLLITGLEKKFFDAAIVVQRKNGYKAEAVVVTDVEGIKRAKGTKYLRVPMISKVEEALKEGRRRIAVVGTPCEVRAVRKLQRGYLEQEFPGTEITIIGLFCFESFDYEGLKEDTKRILGIDLDQADKTQITHGNYIVSIGEKENSCSVRDLGNVIREGCSYCNDLVSWLADISVGSIGSPDGYSTVIVRSNVGKKLLDATDFITAEVDKDDIVKLVKLKRRNSDRKVVKILEGLNVSAFK